LTDYFKLKSLRLKRFSARREAPADATGKRRGVGGELLNQSKHLAALRRRKLDERLPQPQTLDGFTGRKSKLGTDFRSRCAIFHSAPFSGKFKRQNKTSRSCRARKYAKEHQRGQGCVGLRLEWKS